MIIIVDVYYKTLKILSLLSLALVILSIKINFIMNISDFNNRNYNYNKYVTS